MKTKLLTAILCLFGIQSFAFWFGYLTPGGSGTALYFNYLGGDSVEITFSEKKIPGGIQREPSKLPYYTLNAQFNDTAHYEVPMQIKDGYGKTYRVVHIGDYAFANDKMPNDSVSTLRKTAIFPSSIRSIGKYAFRNNPRFKNMVIPNVDSISDGAFERCINLDSLTHTRQVKFIGKKAFAGCSNLKKFDFADSISNWKPGYSYVCDNEPRSGGSTSYSCFENCTSLTSISIPQQTFVPRKAFLNCTNLSSIQIPQVKTIGELAFAGTKVTRVDFPHLKHIFGGAFYNCPNLASLALHQENVTIHDTAFYNCTTLSSISTPNSGYIGLGERTFTNTPWFNTQPEGLVYLGNALLGYRATTPKDVMLRDGTTSIASMAFANCQTLYSCRMPNTVRSPDYEYFSELSENVFYGCSNLWYLQFPESESFLYINGHKYFWGCHSLSYLQLPDQFYYFDKFGFENSALRELEVGHHLLDTMRTCTPSLNYNMGERDLFYTVVVPSSMYEYYSTVRFGDLFGNMGGYAELVSGSTVGLKPAEKKTEKEALHIENNGGMITLKAVAGKEIVVYDLFGKKTFQHTPTSDSYQIDFLPRGIYIVKVGDDVREKIIVR